MMKFWISVIVGWAVVSALALWLVVGVGLDATTLNGFLAAMFIGYAGGSLGICLGAMVGMTLEDS